MRVSASSATLTHGSDRPCWPHTETLLPLKRVTSLQWLPQQLSTLHCCGLPRASCTACLTSSTLGLPIVVSHCMSPQSASTCSEQCIDFLSLICRMACSHICTLQPLNFKVDHEDEAFSLDASISAILQLSSLKRNGKELYHCEGQCLRGLWYCPGHQS